MPYRSFVCVSALVLLACRVDAAPAPVSSNAPAEPEERTPTPTVAAPSPDPSPPTPAPVAVEPPTRALGCSDDVHLRGEVVPRSDGAADGSVREEQGDDQTWYVLSTTLDGKPVDLRLDAFELTEGQRHGAVIAIDPVDVGGGVLLLVHHDLDTLVDPPRFFASRWTDVWWIPPDFRTGDCPRPIETEGQQHQTAWVVDDGTACLSDALGATRRFAVDGQAIVDAPTIEPCETRAAEQRDWMKLDREMLHRAAKSGVGVDSDSLGGDCLVLERVREFALASDLRVFALDVHWENSARYEKGEDVPKYPSTRLVAFDTREGATRARWYYAEVGGQCRARRRRRSVSCGSRTFDFSSPGKVTVTAPH